MASTEVSQSYTPSLNVSVTTEGDKILLVTKWRTGDDATKTVRVGQTSNERNGFLRK